MKRSHIWQVNIGIGVTLLLLLVNAVVSIRNIVNLADNKQQVAQSRERLLNLEQTFSTIKDAETGQRGYLLTGREPYLAPYNLAIAQLQDDLWQLRQVAVSDADLQQRVQKLDQAIALKLADLEKTIQLRRTQGLAAALAVVNSDRGKQLMNQVRQEIAAMQTLENQRLDQRQQEFQRSLNLTLLTFTLVNAGCLVLLSLIGWMHRRNDLTQQRTTQQLQESAQLFASTFNQAAVGIAHVGLDGSWLRVNQKLCDIVGYSHAELLTKTFQDITHPDDLNTDLNYVQQILNDEIQTYSLEKRYICKNGLAVWVNLTVALMRDEVGQPKQFISVVEDISDRKAAELKLQERDELLELLVKYAPVDIIMCDRDMRYLLLTQQAIDTYNLDSIPTLIGRSHYDVFPTMPEYWKQIHRRCLAGAVERCDEDLFVNPNGVEQWFRWEVRPWYTPTQEIGGIIIFSEEITVRKRMEDHLRQSEEGLRRVLEEMPVMLDALDETFNIIVWNQECERVTGYAAEEVIHNSNILEQFYPDEEYRNQMLANWLERGNNYRNWEWNITCKDGSQRTISWSNISELFPIPGWASWGIGVDITDRKQAEEALRQLNATLEQRVADRTAQLEEVNQELQAFTYSVSHDLRAPLRIMQGFAQALEEDYGDRLDEMAHTYIRGITDSAIQMDGLIGDLLAYSRLTRAQIEIAPTDLNRVIAAALQLLQPQIEATGATIAIAPNLPQVLAHPATLVQVLTNLLSNAIKFVAPGTHPVVTVEWTVDQNQVCLSVRDNGIGIDPAHQARIFRVFERLHGVETYPGTGIGLAIVEKGVERMGGRVGMESQLGQGSRFWLELPLAAPPIPLMPNDSCTPD